MRWCLPLILSKLSNTLLLFPSVLVVRRQGLTLQPTLAPGFLSSGLTRAAFTDVHHHACLGHWIISKAPSPSWSNYVWSKTSLLTIHEEHPAFHFLFIWTKFLTDWDKEGKRRSLAAASSKQASQQESMLPGPGLSSAEISLFIFVPIIYFFTQQPESRGLGSGSSAFLELLCSKGTSSSSLCFNRSPFLCPRHLLCWGRGWPLPLCAGGEEKSTSDHGLRLLWIPCCAPGCINRQFFFFSPKAKY